MSQYRAERKLNRIVAGIVQPNGEPISPNPLQWWSQRATRFPILAHMAKKICIPATSAPVERLFSTAGNTSIANDRTRLLPENAEDLIFLHDAWPKCKSLL